MQERRKELRQRSYFGAQIQFDSRTQTMDCLVRNLHAHGARIEFHNTAALPSRFIMVIPQKGTRHDARIIWRGFEAAGVEFLDTISERTRIPSLTLDAGF